MATLVEKPVNLSFFKEGLDEFHEQTHPVFQAESEKTPRLVSAINVDIDDAGRIFTRQGLNERLSFTNVKNIYSALGLLLVQDGGTIYNVLLSNNTKQEIVTGLNSSNIVEFTELGGWIWWTNGEVCGRINSSAVNFNWGLSVPDSPVLGSTAGSLSSGRYLVIITYEDAEGNESGASSASLITLLDDKDITVDILSADSNATHANIYVSGPNQETVFWVARIAIDAFPYTVSDVRVSTRPLRTQFMQGPIPGDGLFSYKSFLMIFKDNVIFRNNGQNPHLFFPNEHIIQLPSNIITGVGLANGFWILTESHGAWWFTGQAGEWRSIKKDNRNYAKGSLVIPGSEIPALESPLSSSDSEETALFISEDGLMAGMSSGKLSPLIDDRLTLLVTGKRAHITTHKKTNFSQILFSLN